MEKNEAIKEIISSIETGMLKLANALPDYKCIGIRNTEKGITVVLRKEADSNEEKYTLNDI